MHEGKTGGHAGKQNQYFKGIKLTKIILWSFTCYIGRGNGIT